MARTRASIGAKVSSFKNSKSKSNAPTPPSTPSTPAGTGEKTSRSYSGGNPVCPRETPKWQKPITNFFVGAPSKDGSDVSDDDQVSAGPSKPKTKVNIIESDEEQDIDVSHQRKNQELDESIILEPLNGDSSHKIEEYYANKDKDKASVAKDLNDNSKLNKRHLEDSNEIHQPSKRVKTSST